MTLSGREIGRRGAGEAGKVPSKERAARQGEGGKRGAKRNPDTELPRCTPPKKGTAKEFRP